MTTIIGDIDSKNILIESDGDGSGGLSNNMTSLAKSIKRNRINSSNEELDSKTTKKSLWRKIPLLSRGKRDKGIEKYADCFSKNFNTKENDLKININKRNIL